MPWIESWSTLAENKKTREVARILKIKPALVVGHITCLWHKVIEQAEDGDITDWSLEDIAYYAKWEDDPEVFYKAVKTRFIDEKRGKRLIHDWLDYAWKYLYGKYHQNNPNLLKHIALRYGFNDYTAGRPIGRPKGAPKGLPQGDPPTNLPNQQKEKADGNFKLLDYKYIQKNNIRKLRNLFKTDESLKNHLMGLGFTEHDVVEAIAEKRQ